MPVHLTAFGGAGVIGGNKLLLESSDHALWLDFGTDFSRRSGFYDAFGGPRPAAGLRDLLTLGLLPPIRGIYRADLDPPAIDLWPGLAARPDARDFAPAEAPPVLLSHAHFDHVGALSFLAPETPVFTSAITAALLKAGQDSASNDIEAEVAYVVPREPKDGLVTAGNYRTTPAVGRPISALGLTDAPQLAAFWATAASARGLSGPTPLDWQPGTEGGRVAGLNVLAFPVDHSVPGALAFAVETDGGWVVYSGDLRRHGARGAETQAFVAAAASLRPLALIIEGTQPRSDWPTSEAAVYENALLAVKVAQGLVIADFALRNTERLGTFARIARETGRRLVVTPRDAYLLAALATAGVSEPPDVLIYCEAKLVRSTWERNLLDRCADRVVTARELRAAAGEFIVCFGLFDLPELIDIAPRGGTYIRSTSEAPSEGAAFDAERLRHWLGHFGIRLAGGIAGGGRGHISEAAFHASGHIDGPGIADLIAAVAPEWVIPVHTTDRAFFRTAVRPHRLLWPEAGTRHRLA